MNKEPIFVNLDNKLSTQPLEAPKRPDNELSPDDYIFKPAGNYLFIEIPESAWYNGKLKLTKPRITGFLPIEAIGATAGMTVIDNNGVERQIQKGDYAMIEGIEYPVIDYDNRQFLLVGSYQILAFQIKKQS